MKLWVILQLQFLANLKKIFYKTTNQKSFIFGLKSPQETQFLVCTNKVAVIYRLFWYNLQSSLNTFLTYSLKLLHISLWNLAHTCIQMGFSSLFKSSLCDLLSSNNFNELLGRYATCTLTMYYIHSGPISMTNIRTGTKWS